MTSTDSIQIEQRRRDDPRSVDQGKVRIGDSSITAKLPLQRRRDDPRSADLGKVRIGDSSITARLPVKK
jgi:hypothetical protein